MKYILILVLFVSISVQAQNDSIEINKNRIEAIAEGYSDSIVIRWAPTTPIVWQLANRYGYKIERLTILQNGKFNENAEVEKEILYESLKPLNEQEWQKLIETNDKAEIVYEMIYGEQENNSTQDFISALNKYRELEQRFGFALFTCDLYPDVAKAAALMLVDKSVNINNQYIYRIHLANTPEGFEIDMGSVVLNSKEEIRKPYISELSVQQENRKASLSWNVESHSGIYTAYIVERSIDNINFKTITDAPISPMGEEDEPKYAFFSDSIQEEGSVYHYRVVGVTPFGSKGPYSETVSVVGAKSFAAAPIIDTIIENVNNIEIQWHLETEVAVKELNIYRASEYEGPYTKLNSEGLSIYTKRWLDETYKDAGNALYYRLEAIGENPGEISISLPRLLYILDSIPPASPTGLKGQANKQGQVSITWNNNTERDLLGYRIFRANSLNEDFVEISNDIISETAFNDKIDLKTVTPKVYYTLVALDLKFNTSDYSDTLEIVRPDTIPPVPPVIIRTSIDQNGMAIYWEYGPSTDVAKYDLYRICKEINEEILIDTWENNPLRTYYADKTAKEGLTYNFKIVATDFSGNSSEVVSREFILVQGIKPAITTLKADVNREKAHVKLTWNYNLNENVDVYYIYKSSNGSPLILYKTISNNDTSEFIDTDVQVNNNYRYSIKALFKNSEETRLSKKLEVKY